MAHARRRPVRSRPTERTHRLGDQSGDRVQLSLRLRVLTPGKGGRAAVPRFLVQFHQQLPGQVLEPVELHRQPGRGQRLPMVAKGTTCLLYTSDAADEEDSVDL